MDISTPKEIRKIKLFELTQSYRQASDPNFVRILDAFRFPMTHKRKLEELPGTPTTIEAVYTIQKRDKSGHITIKHSDLPVVIDLNSRIFAPGQLYVALSRARSLKGLFLTKPVSYSDIISDESVLQFLFELRKANGMSTKELEPLKHSVPIHDNIGERLVRLIQNEERNESAKECILYALNSYYILASQGETKKASWELRKIVDILLQTYQIDESTRISKCFNQQISLQEILDIYAKIIHCPQKQYQPTTGQSRPS